MAFKKLPKRYAAIIMPLILSMFMSGVVSAVSVLRANGINAQFFDLWPSAWGLSWMIAFPVVLVVFPIVRKIVSLIVET
jgi:hypothetical protein